MTNLYHIAFTRISTRRTTAKRTRRVVAPNLEEAVSRLLRKAEHAHPGATVIIESASVYDHNTQSWVKSRHMTSKAKEGDKINWYCDACKRTHKGSTEQVSLSDGRTICRKQWLAMRAHIFKPLKKKG